MNSLDMVVASVMAVTIIIGVLRGAVREVFSVVAVVAGGLLAMHFNDLTGWTLLRLTSHQEVNDIISFLLIFVFSSVLISYAGGHFSEMISRVGFRLWNTAGGLFVGALKGMVICTFIVFMLMVFLPADSGLTSKSATFPFLSELARLVSPVAPESLRKEMDKRLEKAKEAIRLPGGGGRR